MYLLVFDFQSVFPSSFHYHFIPLFCPRFHILSFLLFSTLLYFTAIKPGNFNQVAQHEFLQGQERKSELLFNAAALSFLLSTSTIDSFLPQLNSTLVLYSLWFNFQFVLQRYLPGGWRSVFVLMCLYNTSLWYSLEHSLMDTCIWI